MRGTPGGSQPNVGSTVITPPGVFNSAVLASNLAFASGSMGGGFPTECRPPPNPPDHWPDRSRGSNAACFFAPLEAVASWARAAGATTSANTRIVITKGICAIFIEISIMAFRR